MRRRDVLIGGAAALAWPLAALGQATGKTWRIGILETVPEVLNGANLAPLLRGLRERGYVEGQNLVILYRSADGHEDRFAALAQELVRAAPDLIVTRGTPAAVAAKHASATIPIVMASSADPLASGAVASLARPGANVTGLSALVAELVPKRIELLREFVPGLARIATLENTANSYARHEWDEVQASARTLGIECRLIDVHAPEDVDRALEAGVAPRVDALLVGLDTVLQTSQRRIVAFAADRRLPAIYAARDFVDAGGLVSYGVDYAYLYGRAAVYIDKILRGAKPADLPVEQPVQFALVINLKTAKALGLAVPPALLARADEVIE